MELTGYQVIALSDFVGDDKHTKITLKYLEQESVDIDGEPRPAGLYAWFTEYPDEGSVHLPESCENFMPERGNPNPLECGPRA